jgi:hypothetical protein
VRRPAADRATSASLKTVALDSGIALYTIPQPQLEHHTMAKNTKKLKIAIKGAKKAAKKAKKLDTQVDRSDIPLKPSFSS